MAREALQGRWSEAAVASLVVFLLAGVVAAPYYGLSVAGASMKLAMLTQAGAGVYMCALVLLMLPLYYAFQFVFLRMRRDSQVALLPDTFRLFAGSYKRAVKVSLLMLVVVMLIAYACLILAVIPAVMIMLGMCPDVADFADYITCNVNTFVALFVSIYFVALIPLYIYAYGISMYVYVSEERPDLGARQCLKESRRLMKGHKWQLFCLDLSFIGWMLLCILTLGIGILWLSPYQYTAHAAFYEDLVAAEAAAADPFATVEPVPENA